jgi:hypothetical protein
MRDGIQYSHDLPGVPQLGGIIVTHWRAVIWRSSPQL